MNDKIVLHAERYYCILQCSEIELKDCFNKVVICYKYDESVQGFIYFINFQVAEVQ